MINWKSYIINTYFDIQNVGRSPFIILRFYEWLITNLIMDSVNNFRDYVFNKIRDQYL